MTALEQHLHRVTAARVRGRDVQSWPKAAVRRDAAIFPVLDDKPTLRGDRECVEFNPGETPGLSPRWTELREERTGSRRVQLAKKQ